MKTKNGFTMISKAFTMIRKSCMLSHRRKSCHGFTMIELLVVITVMVVLISILLVSFQGVRNTSRDARRKADLEQIRSALEICKSDAGAYPNSIYTTGKIICNSTTYLESTPTDPLDSTQYYYSYDATNNTYILCSSMEDTTLVSNLCSPGTCRSSICNYKVINP